MYAFAYDNEIFTSQNYSGQTVTGKEYQSCTFKKCDFTESNYIDNKFLDCTFEDCNLTMIRLDKSTLSNVLFKSCKLLGLNFRHCADFLFSVSFENCLLDYAVFIGKKMPKTAFVRSSLKEVNFSDANLSGSVFQKSDLSNAVLNNTNLASADFSTAYNFLIDPELNQVKNAIFSEHSLKYLLTKYNLRIL